MKRDVVASEPLPEQPESPRSRTRRVFIGGCERSGTTFLAAEMSQWTGLTFVPESYFLLEVLQTLDAPGASARDLILDHWRFRAWDLPTETVRSEIPDGSSAQFCMDDLARRYTQRLGHPSFEGWIEHTPFNTAHLHVLDRYFDDAKYIHIVRDGRAVASSILRADFGPTTIRSAALWWQAHTLPGLLAHLREPDRVLQVRYEDLVTDPDRVKQSVLSFLGTSRSGADEAPTAPVRVDPIFQRTHELVGKPADPSRADAWKRSLTDDQIAEFESLAGGSLIGLGYALHSGRARPPRRALRYFDSVLDSVRQLVWQLPKRTLYRWRAHRERRRAADDESRT